ncbi:MAG: rplW [Candidatus Taylorbacteria bacterium]|nr:rplW [Candidatus Taylorbacteria bacterium]
MALFGKKTEKKVEEKAAAPVKAVAKKASTKRAAPVKAKKVAKPAVVKSAPAAGSIKTDVIIRPHITEKAGLQAEALNVYTFEVTKTSTKHTISKAITALYKVIPAKVRIINLPAKEVLVRGKWGTQSAIKKALVYLKKGDKIEIA